MTQNLKKYLYIQIFRSTYHVLDSLVGQRLKHLSTMQETWVQSLGREVPCA